jgi:hypothetical protein
MGLHSDQAARLTSGTPAAEPALGGLALQAGNGALLVSAVIYGVLAVAIVSGVRTGIVWGLAAAFLFVFSLGVALLGTVGILENATARRRRPFVWAPDSLEHGAWVRQWEELIRRPTR